MLLSSQFQGFCRDLHDEAVDHVVAHLQPAPMRTALRELLTEGRKIDRGNPNAGNLGSDYGRIGLKLWDELKKYKRTDGRQKRLEQLNKWRNAVAHHDFTDPALSRSGALGVVEVRNWRSACEGLARAMDVVTGKYVESLTGHRPW